MSEVMNMRPKGRMIWANGQSHLALSYNDGKTWVLTSRRGEIPCDMDYRGFTNEDGSATLVSFGWDGTAPVEPEMVGVENV